MAKKKTRKETKKEFSGKLEIYGILLILVAIIGCCKFRPASDIINGFSGFLVGVLWAFFLVIVGFIGSYMIVKRKKPDLLTVKLIGLYIMVIGFLSLFHLGYFKGIENPNINNVMEATFNNLNNFIDGSSDIQGGGMIGAVVSSCLVGLLTLRGAMVVSIVIIICGFIMTTGLSIYDLVVMLNKSVKNTVKKTHELSREIKQKDIIKKIEHEYENDNVVISKSDDDYDKQVDERPVYKKEEATLDIETIELEEIENSNSYEVTRPYVLPKTEILSKSVKVNTKENQEVIKDTVSVLQEVFRDFQIDARVVAVNIGPAVTQYELEIKAGTKLSKVISLDKEIALALAAKSVNIQAPIPGKKTIGIDLPNRKVSPVGVKELLESVPASLKDSKLLVTLGKDIMGKPTYCEINKTPHLLVAGSTGSGKSVCINSMLVSILMRTKPDEVKLVLVDPKKVELSIYNGVPHLLIPVVTDPKKANIALKKIVQEMENRYDLFEASGTKNIAGYNAYLEKKHGSNYKKLPYIVVIIDELADLMLVAAKEVEESIMRITQMARAAGIHLIVATQRPSTDVITGVVKANIPSRISFAVSSSIDSRTILDATGAEKLLGKGDMLFLPQGESIPVRVQGTFISDDDIKRVVDYTISQQKAKYDTTFSLAEEDRGATTGVSNEADEEPLYNDIVDFVIQSQKASASLLQRRFKIGYNRAARAIDLLEERGVVGPNNGSKPREVLYKPDSE